MLENENTLSFAEAAKRLPTINGRKPHVSTLWRWARRGIGGVKLETRRLGGRFVTSIEALDRFSKELAEIPPPSSVQNQKKLTSNHPSLTPSVREVQVKNALYELEKDGI